MIFENPGITLLIFLLKALFNNNFFRGQCGQAENRAGSKEQVDVFCVCYCKQFAGQLYANDGDGKPDAVNYCK